ncbi:MAG: hydroxyacid dehydrogenase [Cephaloticoccus sp.]|nr:hydroxyacid dehydrogenase [Cephaloticoccus sp.]MCF7761002.1 hydroxyacid dehydrogenase [Cephaloticoccus sp.]
MTKPASILALISNDEARDFLPEPLASELRSLSPNFARHDPTKIDAAQCHRLLAELNPEVLVAAWKTPALPAILPSNLRYVCYLCGSVKKLVTRKHLEQGLLLTNWGGSISRIVAEWALFHTLSCLRRATSWALVMHLEKGWKNSGTETASLFGRSIGIHGFGMVARELIHMLRPFGVRIQVFAPDVDAATEQDWGIRRPASLEALFAENDIIIELAPLIPETTGIITERLLRLIRPGGVFVNVGRGAVVDEAALLRVAREGNIQIGLDVFTHEPLPTDSAFRGLRNVTLTPHLAGPTNDRRRDAGAFSLRNLQAYAAGTALEAVVTPPIFDHSS